MLINVHQSIKEKLEYFHKVHKIPNILFHGSSGSGKRTIVNNFINTIYGDDKEEIKKFVMYVNCAHGKGIKFIREELKFFAKMHIHSNGGDTFKSIVLMNADKLTMDAQSAMRRCIELFSHTTRFFIIVEDKHKMLKPILSRFCEIYIPEPQYNGKTINLYTHNLSETFHFKQIKTQRNDWLKKELSKSHDTHTPLSLAELSLKLYEKAYSGLDIIRMIENPLCFTEMSDEKKYELLLAFNKVRKEFRNEKIMILFILNFLFLNVSDTLENFSFM